MMEKQIMLLFILGGLVAISLIVFATFSKSIFGPTTLVITGDQNSNDNIQHCSLSSDAVVNEERLAGSSEISAEDDNARLTLLVDKANATEFENQRFSVEVHNKAKEPVVFLEISGEHYTITGYNESGNAVFILGGPNYGYGYVMGMHDSPPSKPACFINQGETATFDASTRIGTKNHNTTTIMYTSASVKYHINGKEKILQNLGSLAQNESLPIDVTKNSHRLLKVVVNPVSIPKMTHYFDVALAIPYPPELGEEKPLYVLARSQYYVGPYTIKLFIPEELQVLSGKTEIQDEFNSHSKIDVTGKPVSPVVEQQPEVIRIQPQKTGNYAIQAIIYSVFNGTRVGYNDTIWLSVSDNATSSFFSRKELPKSIMSSARLGGYDISEIIQDNDPIPHARIGVPTNSERGATYHDPVAVDYSWPDGINWMQSMPESIFATVNPAFYPQIVVSTIDKNSIISVNNGTTLKLSVENAVSQPSLLVVDFYNNQDIFGKSQNNSHSYSSCIIYSPTSNFRFSNPYQQCPIENSFVLRNTAEDFVAARQAKQYEKHDYVYDLSIVTKKTGLYTIYVYAQWASHNEIRFNEKYRTADSQFTLDVSRS